jgi:hypothetical protein
VITVRGHQQHIHQWLAKAALTGVGWLKAGWVSLAVPMRRHTVSDIYTTDHNSLPSVDCDAFGLTADVSGIKVWVIPLQSLPVLHCHRTLASKARTLLLDWQQCYQYPSNLNPSYEMWV